MLEFRFRGGTDVKEAIMAEKAGQQAGKTPEKKKKSLMDQILGPLGLLTIIVVVVIAGWALSHFFAASGEFEAVSD